MLKRQGESKPTKRASKLLEIPQELPSSASPNFELMRIFEDLQRLFALEYDRGSNDAKTRILQAFSVDNVGASTLVFGPEGKISRAPRGAAKLLVQRALASGPKTIAEIRAAAETDVERFLSYQTIRLALELGKKRKKYKKDNKKWAMVG
jgi:hypothetical protein